MVVVRSKSKRSSPPSTRLRILVAVATCGLAVIAFGYFQGLDETVATEKSLQNLDGQKTPEIISSSDPPPEEPITRTPSPTEAKPDPTPAPSAIVTKPPRSKRLVSCGGHLANTCEECPQGNGMTWCNGDCGWCPQMGTCMPKSTLCSQCGKKATGVTACESINPSCLWCDEQSKCMESNDFCTNSTVLCGSHSAPTCRQCPQGNGKAWCNGECAWCDPIKICMPKVKVCTSTCGRGENATCENADNVCSWCHDKTQCLPTEKFCPRPLVWSLSETESWFVEPTATHNLTLSIILPCGHEYLFFEPTIMSILNTTPAAILHEIIIVDDNSDPPLESIAEKTYPQVKYVRSNETLGLIKAKHVGSEAATGDIIVFFDCHVKPAQGWWEPMVREIAENPKRVVVPTITNLNVKTWQEFGRPSKNNGGSSKCYLTFGADFPWTSDDTPWVPIMSGGLLAIKKSWFFELGGHDQEMKGWGGENIDLSLRIWRCGGEIVYAEKSYVAHMFREKTSKETTAKYKIPANAAPRNRARAMKAHTGMFYDNKTKIFRDFQKLTDIETASIDAALEKLQCKDFFWYLDKFAHIYRDAGLIPKEVFQITPDGGKSCLALKDTAAWGYPVTDTSLLLESCDMQDGFSAIEGRQFFHLGARNAKGKCCSGLRLWNTQLCMTRNMKLHLCDLNDGRGQRAGIAPEGYLKVEGKCWSVVNKTLSEADCSKSSTKWTKLRPFVPEEYNLLSPELKSIW